jgi:DNA processing protein
VVDPGVSSCLRDEEEVQAFLALKREPGLGDRGIGKLVELFGSGASALAALRRDRARAMKAMGGAWGSRRIPEPVPDFPPWDRTKYRILPMTSPFYPSSLRELTDPPPLLFLRGREELLHRPAVAVVGSRKATEVGRRTAEALGRILAQAGVTVVSGLALGIDGAAHEGALQAGGDTVAVLGSGLDVVYPPGHRKLFRTMATRGLLVSEFLPPEPSLPHHFPRRNRIIAALTRAVVVVEAARQSGAFITVDHALDLGRDVLAVPGSVESPLSEGTNALLKEGAKVLPTPKDILPELEELFGGSLPGGASQEGDPPPSVPPHLRPLLAALTREPQGVDALALEARLPSSEALAGLLSLELDGWALQCPGLRFQLRGGDR